MNKQLLIALGVVVAIVLAIFVYNWNSCNKAAGCWDYACGVGEDCEMTDSDAAVRFYECVSGNRVSTESDFIHARAVYSVSINRCDR